MTMMAATAMIVASCSDNEMRVAERLAVVTTTSSSSSTVVLRLMRML